MAPLFPTTLSQAGEGGLDSCQIRGEEVPHQAPRDSRAERWPGAPQGAATRAPKAFRPAPARELQIQAR